MSKKIIQVLGPTGVGKSRIAVQLAGRFGGEVISADSMQVYNHFNIGTDKITPEKMQGIPHHLVNILNDCSQFNSSRFLETSFAAAEDISERGLVPIVCGGTALYLRCMIKGIFPESDRERVPREELNRIVREKGLPYLWNRLNRIDPLYAQKIGPNDRIRIVRGMEIYYNNGIPPSEIFKKNVTPFSGYTFIRVGLNLDRKKLYSRIETRVDQMIRDGLVDEVKDLSKKYPPHCPPFKSLGYKEICMYLDGTIDLDKAIELIKQHTRNFAKRQLSWFRRETGIHWFSPGESVRIEAFVEERLGPCRRPSEMGGSD